MRKEMLFNISKGDVDMKFKLTRDSNGRKNVSLDEKVTTIEINTLEELMDFINKEDQNVIITPKSFDGVHWIRVDDFFED